MRSHKKSGVCKNPDVIPNPFELKDDFTRRRDSRSSNVEILIMGRLIEGKGFIETLHAFSLLPGNYSLTIAGDGVLRDRIKSEIHILGIAQRVKMTGWIGDKEKHRLLASVDVFCLPSRVDSFGMSFVEALAYDLPVVAFNHPPVVEVIRKSTSVIVNSLEPQEIARAIMAATDIGCSIVPGSGREWVKNTFGIERTSVELKQLIENLISDFA